jgi:hypothetical protein
MKTISKLPIRIESFLPVFNGFYGTIFEPCEDLIIEEPYNYDDYEFEYMDYRLKVSKLCTFAIEIKLKEIGIDIAIKFQDVFSPREYNFTNDSINVQYKLTAKTNKQILDYLANNQTKFAEYINDHFTSRSGFISFYSNDANVWLNEYLPENHNLNVVFGTVLDFVLTNEGFDDEALYQAANFDGEIFLDGHLKTGVENAVDFINQYTNDNYEAKNQETIVIELIQHFDTNNINFDFLTFKYIESIVNDVFKAIGNKTLNLFAKVKN